MTYSFGATHMLVAATLLLGACADGNGLLTTSALTTADSKKAEAEKAAAQQKALACNSLAARIDQLKADGTVGRLEDAATGKSTVVRVKRDALARQAELNKAYADYRASCGVKPAGQAQTKPTGTPAKPTASATTTPAKPQTVAAAVPAQQQRVPANQSLVGPVTPTPPAAN